MESKNKILVVDDSNTNLLKLGMAVAALGHEAVKVDNGREAIQLTETEDFDAILLDIVMPEMDGFEVLRWLKENERLQHIPVIVISALEDEKENVARAIELGAEDFLPKDFDRVVFEARVNCALQKKRNLDANRRYLQEVGVITHAAEILENGPVNPERLGLESVSTEDDSLRRLADVFQDMAGQIYARERRLRQQINMLRGVLLLLAVGVIDGLSYPLSKIAVEIESNPIGLAFWINFIAALTCLPFAIYWKSLPKLTWPLVRFFCIWGFVTAIACEVLLFWVVDALPASLVSIIVVTEGFIVFIVAGVLRIEKLNLRRFLGIVVGLVGIVTIVIAAEGLVGSSSWIWILLAIGIPLGYAIEDLLVAAKMPAEVNTLAATTYVCAVSAVLLLPIAFVFNDFVALSINPGKLEVSIVLIGVTGALNAYLFIKLIETTGAVFSSQAGYVITFAGIAWSIILLGESLSLLTWAGLAVIIIGLLIVGPQEEEEPELDLAELPAK